MELLEIWNKQLKPSGILKDREQIHRDGDIHGVVRIHILRVQDNCIEILLQKRSMQCEAFPGFYDIACAGHVHGYEHPIETAKRELKEELGIFAEVQDLHFVGTDFKDFSQAAYLDKEYSFLYMYVKTIDNLTLQIEEVESVEWIDVMNLLPLLDDSLTTYCILKNEVDLILQAYKSFMKL